jgi:ParB-like chromosome segregation protein Spo0J
MHYGQDRDLAEVYASVKLDFVTPPVVMGPSPYLILDGHRRIEGLRAQGKKDVTVQFAGENLGKDRAFWIALICNANAAWTDLDRAWILKLAKQYVDLHHEHNRHILGSVLKLKPSLRVMEDYLAVAALDESVLKWMESDQLPFRGAQGLCQLALQDQQTFAQKIAANTAFTTNELMRTIEWLTDEMRRTGQALNVYLDKSGLQTLLHRPHGDLRQKTEQFYNQLQTLRNPQLTAYEDRFAEESRVLCRNTPEIQLGAAQAFEDEGYWLRVHLREPASLDRLLSWLMDRKNSLNSLFDIML